ncbi:MAG: phosphate ABC transporter permease PstA [Oscillospiraceae bacterium]
MKKINRLTFEQRLRMYKRSPISFLYALLVLFAAAITVAVIVFLIGYILIMGVPSISLDLFSMSYNSENVSLMPALINTFTMAGLSLLIACPLGVFSAVFLVEYAKRGSKLVEAVRLTTETLAGIPSIVYGLFGALFFVVTLKLGLSLMSGALTLSIMILPLIMRNTEEALRSVPDSYREGSFGLGAGRLRTVFRIVIPSAMHGILSGVILAIGRIVGESAALIYTAGTAPNVPTDGLLGSGRTLSVHMYVLANEGLHIDKAYATAVVLLLMVALINALSYFIAGKLSKG